jgi:hypothetical protein
MELESWIGALFDVVCAGSIGLGRFTILTTKNLVERR